MSRNMIKVMVMIIVTPISKAIGVTGAIIQKYPGFGSFPDYH